MLVPEEGGVDVSGKMLEGTARYCVGTGWEVLSMIYQFMLLGVQILLKARKL